MRETAVKRISFFLEFLMLYEVYNSFFSLFYSVDRSGNI